MNIKVAKNFHVNNLLKIVKFSVCILACKENMNPTVA